MQHAVKMLRSEEILSSDRAERFFVACDLADLGSGPHFARDSTAKAAPQSMPGFVVVASRGDFIRSGKRAELATDMVRRIDYGGTQAYD